MTLRTLNYGNYGIFLIMGNAGFCPSAVSLVTIRVAIVSSATVSSTIVVIGITIQTRGRVRKRKLRDWVSGLRGPAAVRKSSLEGYSRFPKTRTHQPGQPALREIWLPKSSSADSAPSPRLCFRLGTEGDTWGIPAIVPETIRTRTSEAMEGTGFRAQGFMK